MDSANRHNIERLLEKGVKIPAPESVEIGQEVDADRISGENVVLHAGCRIYGDATFIMPNVELGYEAPVTVDNCRIGTASKLKGGFFQGAVFLEKTEAGLGAHVREGTILEEQAGFAHCVALKQSILFPYVTIGSLVNFCDVFMAGGTSRKNHSEVGSSYIHFNFTPNQDKATPSLIGDVPGGVMLDRRPVFLGGQGGLVGPCRLAFGTTVAAGTIYRKDELREGRLLFGGAAKEGSIPMAPGFYRSIQRIVHNNLIYIANLMALNQWYRHVRKRFVSDDFPEPLYEGLVQTLKVAVAERIHRLGALSEKMPDSIAAYRSRSTGKSDSPLLRQKEALHRRWPDVKSALEAGMGETGDERLHDAFQDAVLAGIESCGKSYLAVIHALEPAARETGTRWLQGIVDAVVANALARLPSQAFGAIV